MVDAYTKGSEAVIHKTIGCLRGLFAAYGLPQQIISDNGPQFNGPQFCSAEFAVLLASNSALIEHNY